MVILLALNLLTGMRLGWGYIESWLGGPAGLWAEWLNTIAPKGELLGINLITLHVTLAFLMFLVVGVYVGYLFWSKSSRRLRVRRRDIQGMLMRIVHMTWPLRRTGRYISRLELFTGHRRGTLSI